jgi:Putative DNA-binding domain
MTESSGDREEGPNGLDSETLEHLFQSDAQTAARLARSGENQWIALKSELPHVAGLARELSAFANSGGGVLIAGVRANGDIVGWRAADADDAVRRIRDIATHTLPHPARVRRGQEGDGWLVWAIVSPADEPVVTAEGSYWRRTATQIYQDELPAQSQLSIPKLSSRSGPIRVFVAMSFRQEEEPALVDYWHAMQRAAKQAKAEFELRRIDEVEGDHEIIERMYEEINAADLVIADLTLSPPNVYLEIGYARGRGKVVIQACREGTPLEFDVRGRRTLMYRNATILEEKLLRALDSV